MVTKVSLSRQARFLLVWRRALRSRLLTLLHMALPRPTLRLLIPRATAMSLLPPLTISRSWLDKQV